MIEVLIIMTKFFDLSPEVVAVIVEDCAQEKARIEYSLETYGSGEFHSAFNCVYIDIPQ